MKRLDLTGKRFDKLVCVADVGMDKHGSRTWLCLCDCGNNVAKRAGFLTATRQKQIACNECGDKAKRAATTKHGDSPASGVGRLYSIWSNMRNRCRRNTPKNKYWAGRGITVCDAWQSYPNFKIWAINNGYMDGLVINRINPEGHYVAENCRWVTPSQNTIYSLDRRYGRNK